MALFHPCFKQVMCLAVQKQPFRAKIALPIINGG